MTISGFLWQISLVKFFCLCKLVLSVIIISSYILNFSGKVKRIICYNLHSVSGLEWFFCFPLKIEFRNLDCYVFYWTPRPISSSPCIKYWGSSEFSYPSLQCYPVRPGFLSIQKCDSIFTMALFPLFQPNNSKHTKNHVLS